MGHVCGIIWGMSGASSGACLRHHLGKFGVKKVNFPEIPKSMGGVLGKSPKKIFWEPFSKRRSDPDFCDMKRMDEVQLHILVVRYPLWHV